eukprot:3163523-Lingulodinium_polyedra.AAC.1
MDAARVFAGAGGGLVDENVQRAKPCVACEETWRAEVGALEDNARIRGREPRRRERSPRFHRGR